MNIAKVDTEEGGGGSGGDLGDGGDGLAKDIYHKGEGQEVISVGFSFKPPGLFGTATTQVRLGGTKMACLHLKLQ